MQGMYSMRSPAVKRLMKEAQELREPTEQYECHPLEDNLFEWHFTIRGPADTEFENGFYHGRIVLPPEYPMKPPSIILLTTNGRFETNKKICLSISGHHPESWQPSWSLRTALLAIIGFMPTHGAGALGSLDYDPEERKVLAKRSKDFVCPTCGRIDNILKPVTEASEKTKQEAKELAAQIDFKDEKEKKAALQSASSSPDTPTDQTATPTADTESPGATANIGHQSTPAAFQFSPQQFGQGMFPFQIPFPPGTFPQTLPQQEGNNSTANIPRFPLPFVGPMMPPLFNPMMNPGNFSVPGTGVPPWQQGSTGSGMSAPTGGMPSGGFTRSEHTQSNSSVADTQPQEVVEENINSLNETQTEGESLTQTNSQTGSSETDTVNLSEGLRQRHIQETRPDTAAGQRSAQSTVTQSRSSQSESPAFILFAAVIIGLIALLLFRRIFSMKYFSLLY